MANDVGYSISRIGLSINGRDLGNLRGASKPEILNAAPTRIMGGGNKGLGFNESPDANCVDYPFTIAAPSGDEEFLDRLAADTLPVTLVVTYIDQTNWPDGAYTGIVGMGRLVRQARQDGDELGENAYVVMINGVEKTYKNRPSVVKV